MKNQHGPILGTAPASSPLDSVRVPDDAAILSQASLTPSKADGANPGEASSARVFHASAATNAHALPPPLDPLLVVSEPSRDTPFDQTFWAFHEKNPIIYDTLVRLARRALQRRRRQIGVRMLWEAMRWELTVETVDPNSDYKLNDHYTSRYARLMMAREPDLLGAFELRGLRS